MIRAARSPDSSAVARHYDELDRFYRELWGESLHHGLWRRGDESIEEATENLTRLVAERAAIGPGDRVCDVGSGYGAPAAFFARRHGAHVVGLTLSERQLRLASHRTAEEPNIRFMLRDWLENDFPPACFEAVVAIESASHMPDKQAFLRECRRVLAPGGRVVVAAWLAAEAPARWERRHLLEPICAEGRLCGLATASEYREWMEEAELRPLAFEDLSHGVRRTWTVCVGRVLRRLLGDQEARRYLLDRRRTERVFASAVARIWLAYRTGALRYGIFSATTA